MARYIRSAARQKAHHYQPFTAEIVEVPFDPTTIEPVPLLKAYRRWELEDRINWFGPDSRYPAMLEEWDKQLINFIILNFRAGSYCLAQNRLTLQEFHKVSTVFLSDELVKALARSWREANKPKPKI